MNLDKKEKIEDLQCDNLKIIQNSSLYTFTSDSVILANYIKTKRGDIVVEIGGGCGVISILVQAKHPQARIFIFEIQEKMQELCKKNIKLNKLQDKIYLIPDDVKKFEQYLLVGSIDVVYANPPYFKVTKFDQKDVKKNAKEEVFLNANDLVLTASKMLRFGGAFYCCYPAERSTEIVCLCQKYNMAIKEMFYTENGKGQVKLFIFKAVKGGKSGVKVFPNLVTNDKNGDYLEKLHTKNFL